MDNMNDAKELMARFEAFLDNMERVAVSSSYADLIGIGTEYVVINGEVVAKFLNGNFDTPVAGNSEKTAA
jgi:hypothetical protein